MRFLPVLLATALSCSSPEKDSVAESDAEPSGNTAGTQSSSNAEPNGAGGDDDSDSDSQPEQKLNDDEDSEPEQSVSDDDEPADATQPSGPSDTLSQAYPGDEGLGGDPAVLFFDDFEQGWGQWDRPQEDTEYMHMERDAALAYTGQRYLRSTVTSAHLQNDEYISSQSSIEFPERVGEVYLRYYAQFVGTAPTPHHWVRMAAGNAGFNGSGRANTVPAGNEGFWFDFDANTQDVFNFYVYWHQMRSGRCNDGSTTEGCAGDQGNTYHYGNVFRPPEQTPFPRDEWFCIELHAKANQVGESDGELSFWINDQAVGNYRPGTPDGTWLRDSFHTGGCSFSACTDPQPFEGFDFRSSNDVLFKGFVLDNYYERGSSANKRERLTEEGITPDDAQTILFDNVVIATQRIGCRTTP